MSLLFSLKYTLLITPILMVGGYLLALLTSANTPLRRATRTMIFIPVVIGLGASSLLWYWLFSPQHGFVNAILLDLGLITEPVLWLGVDADRSLWAIIGSVTWKVIGFGMILFIGAIQAIPREVDEASMVDGASAWQRLTRVTLPLTMRTILLVTLISVIGSLLAFDQFYIMTAGQPQNLTATSVFYVYLNSFPYLKLGYGAALSLVLALHRPRGDRRPGRAHPAEPRVSADVAPAGSMGSTVGAPVRRVAAGAWSGRNRYLTAAAVRRRVRGDARADHAVGPRVAQDDRRGGGRAADLHPAAS